MPTSVTDLWSDLLACLDLDGPAPAPGGGSGSGSGSAHFAGRNQRLTYHRLFGGQLLAQFVRAATAVCPDKSVKSLHALFPRAGGSDEPVRYEVERHHEGRAFATATITARQEAGVIATASVSLHAHEDGAELQTVPGVPPVPGPEHEVKLDLLPWETRSAGELDAAAAGPPEYELWMRTPDAAPELAPALAAYATDLTLIGTALRPLDGVSQNDAGKAFTSAVTSHSLWFHRPFRTDDWLLLRQHSPILAHGRCFGRGDLLTADGALVASYAQEALLRLKG
ncbi:acyl-CoA thioesterase [Actinomadura algeriensis]|uniref:Acyl-CoA thioesterase-2 n=1 Tax=Actinomadura algeriensis TaxID=1679523 RepID=A0ABR9JY77_9ACTN|nr:acyl-CoA thioesterase domain-containing protein [Actinomadura algeriensis]MBE1535532.1 acyl-CoA thioesterase-2 [Actinomadura algeriensis]